MHPPFYDVDPKIGPDIHHDGYEKPMIRRHLPAVLTLRPVSSGWPPVPLVRPMPDSDTRRHIVRPVLQIVPPPQSRLRDWIGRWLIRTGQRMILENRPG